MTETGVESQSNSLL